MLHALVVGQDSNGQQLSQPDYYKGEVAEGQGRLVRFVAPTGSVALMICVIGATRPSIHSFRLMMRQEESSMHQ